MNFPENVPGFSLKFSEKNTCVCGKEITDIYDECQRILHAADGAVPDNDDADDAENPAEAEGQRIWVMMSQSQSPVELV